MAVEDIGLADPQALVICNAAKDAYDFLGSPEGELAIAQAVIYIATAPKSNAAYIAYGAAMRTAKEAGSLLPPKHILNAPTKLMQSEGYGDGYDYDHDAPDAFPGRTISPTRSAGRHSTIRPNAVSSARSGNGWNIGPSFGKSGAGRDSRASYCMGGLRCGRHGHAGERGRAVRWPLGAGCAGLYR
jgi:ATPase related to the helicase subunit of the Holliday junction resolvase